MFVGLGGLVLLPLLATIIEPARRNESAVSGAPVRIDHFIREHADFMVRHYVAVAVLGHDLRRAQLGSGVVHSCTAGRRETGLRYGLVLLVFGGAGTVLGGIAAAQLGKRGVQQPAIWITVLHGSAWPLLAMGGWARMAGPRWHGMRRRLLMTLPGGTAIQVVQEAVPNRLRGQASHLLPREQHD